MSCSEQMNQLSTTEEEKFLKVYKTWVGRCVKAAKATFESSHCAQEFAWNALLSWDSRRIWRKHLFLSFGHPNATLLRQNNKKTLKNGTKIKKELSQILEPAASLRRMYV